MSNCLRVNIKTSIRILTGEKIMTTNELIEKFQGCKSAKQLLALAKENKVEFTKEQAEQLFAQLNKSDELSEDELEDAVGGIDEAEL